MGQVLHRKGEKRKPRRVWFNGQLFSPETVKKLEAAYQGKK